MTRSSVLSPGALHSSTKRKINYYVRLEAFVPFDDGGNAQFLLTSGFTYKMLEYLSLTGTSAATRATRKTP